MTPSTVPDRRPAPIRPAHLLAVAAVCVLLLVPFLGKPLHIDDPLFVWSARQIAAHPLDPYGFAGNWGGRQQPFYEFMQNPPGWAYYLAAAARLVGWGEAGLHAAVVPVSVAAAVGTYLLAAEFCRRPLAAALLVVVSPAFLVSATTLMCDVPLLALWVWSVLLWVRGSAAADDRRAGGLLAGAGGLAGAAVLVKYPGIDLVPLLAAHAVLLPAARRRTRLTQAAVLLIPVAALLAWDRVSVARYGVNLFGDAIGLSRRASVRQGLPAVTRALNTFAYIGGGSLASAVVAAVAIVTRGGGGRRVARAGLAVAAVAGLGWTAWVFCPTPSGWDRRGGVPSWGYFAQYGVLVGLGVVVVAACLTGAGWSPARGRGLALTRYRRQGLVLLAWVGGVYAFAAFLNWSVNARSILPLVPAVCILTVRAIDGDRDEAADAPAPPARSRRPLAYAAAAAAVFTVALAVADDRYAVANRDAAADPDLVPPPGRDGRRPAVWFGGHWGFQWYMEHHGYRELDEHHPDYRPGDYIVLPVDNYGTAPMPVQVQRLEQLQMGGPGWVSTWDQSMGAGFYQSWGDHLPFVVGPIPAQTFLINRIQATASAPGR